MKYSRRFEQPNPNIIKNWLSKTNNNLVTCKIVSKNIAIGKKINEILIRKNISRTLLANKINKEIATINRLISGQLSLNIATIVEIETFLGEKIIMI